MFRLNDRGFSKVEFAFSILFLIMMVLYAMKIFERQKDTVKMANQNIEIVTLVHQMRTILRDPVNCTATLKGLPSSTVGEEISAITQIVGQGQKSRSITHFKSGAKVSDESGLSISSYALSTGGLKKSPFKGGSYLVVTFDRGINGLKTRREIKVHTRFNSDNRIGQCSLSSFGEEKSFWSESADSVYIIGKNVSIDTHKSFAKMNIKGPVKFLPRSMTCGPGFDGHIYFDSESNTLRVCTDRGSISLTEGTEISL